MENNQNFKGWRKPSTDFIGSQNQLQTELITVEVDLSTARTFGSLANAPAVIPVAGNSFFIDQNTDVGNAVVIFNDKAVGGNVQSLAPGVYVQPGSIVKVNANVLIIANTAQAGKKLRIHYGVDVDFVPALALTGTSNVNVTNSLLTVAETGSAYGASYKSTTTLAANTPDTVFAPASNTNGAILWSAYYGGGSGGGSGGACFIAKTSAPASVVDGDVLHAVWQSATTIITEPWLPRPVKIAAGKGLYRIAAAAEPAIYASALYTLL